MSYRHIEQEIQQWIQLTLVDARPELNHLSVCPYAESAVRHQQVYWWPGSDPARDLSRMQAQLTQGPEHTAVIYYLEPPPDPWSAVAAAAAPDWDMFVLDPAAWTPGPAGISMLPPPCCMITVHAPGTLTPARTALQQAGYYQNWLPDELAAVDYLPHQKD